MKRQGKALALVLALAFVAGVQVSCESGSAPSVVLIAVNGFQSHQIICQRDLDTRRQGLGELCRSGLRFTHAMTTSTLSVPTLASIMTGLYPYQHGVRHNGETLSPERTTFAEVALRQGYRTAFWSGGPPVWHRSGLDQGFEIFDDHIQATPELLFRPFDRSIELFENWLRGEVDGAPFLATFFVPDLSFTSTPTESDDGERRSLSFESQLEEFDENLGRLIETLKKHRRWDRTTFIVTGLNGREVNARPGEIEPVLLNSENTHVALFIKPSTKPRDEAVQWNVDRNVSLADLGRTLLEIFKAPPPTEDGLFSSVSLLKVLTNPEPDWPEDRPILLESAWGAWHLGLPIRAAVLRDHRLTLDGVRPRQYNMLTDRLEMNVTIFHSPDDPFVAPDIELLRKAGFAPWPGLPEGERGLFQIPALTWLSPVFEQQLLNRLRVRAFDRRRSDRAFRWAASVALQKKDWATLLELGRRFPEESWVYVAERNLKPAVTPPAPPPDPCLRLALSRSRSPQDWKSCSSEPIHRLTEWMDGGDGAEASRRFLVKAVDQEFLKERILKTNAALGLRWLPRESEWDLPSTLSLTLALPELKRWRGQLPNLR